MQWAVLARRYLRTNLADGAARPLFTASVQMLGWPLTRRALFQDRRPLRGSSLGLANQTRFRDPGF